MKTNSEHQTKNSSGQPKQRKRKGERGNALVYVLIAIALFAALSFTLMRNSDSGEAGTLSEDRAELYATQLISYTAQAKSVVDQMLFQRAQVHQLDFTLPNEPTFNDDPTIYKVYHPNGGGLIPGNIPDGATDQITTNPPAGWYLGRFNNVEWTKSTDDDVILTAFQIDRSICQSINRKITGSAEIPALAQSMQYFLIDTASNYDFMVAECPECENYFSLCVSNLNQDAYSFYTILAD